MILGEMENKIDAVRDYLGKSKDFQELKKTYNATELAFIRMELQEMWVNLLING